MIKVINELTLVEKNGKEFKVGEKETIKIESHWDDSDLIVMKIGRNSYTLKAYDVIRAIENSQNKGKIVDCSPYRSYQISPLDSWAISHSESNPWDNMAVY